MLPPESKYPIECCASFLLIGVKMQQCVFRLEGNDLHTAQTTEFLGISLVQLIYLPPSGMCMSSKAT